MVKFIEILKDIEKFYNYMYRGMHEGVNFNRDYNSPHAVIYH